MKKIIKKAICAVGFTMAIVGVVMMMGETPDAGDQLMTSFTGLLVLLMGAGIIGASSGGGEDAIYP